jgi:hypothetical protein
MQKTQMTQICVTGPQCEIMPQQMRKNFCFPNALLFFKDEENDFRQ